MSKHSLPFALAAALSCAALPAYAQQKPFVLPDGRVGGVVFAVSSGDEDVGYAIAASEVEDALATTDGRTAEVDTGPCID